ncbi:hypothetical protein IE53DRAFT_12909 [Violaceomyces palustris]|uniref:Uncharacterized protein n=1 Tax=Violaceomyces palustris TaxID=1673888 RepID=A0ACD0P286_9BASI|nr:hypothetical protein IE53DRAFT_12909 [Violaceomyces palustris]
MDSVANIDNGPVATSPSQTAGAALASSERQPILYVGSLSPRVTEYMLTEIFAVAGPVKSVKIIVDRHVPHAGLNYGFVEYGDMRHAETALQTLSGRKVFDTEIKVNWAYGQQSNNNNNNSGADAQGKQDNAGNYNVFVGDLSPEINDAALRQAFSTFSSLAEARVMWDQNTGKSKGYGFVSFSDKSDAEQSIATMNGEWLGSRTIRVNWASQKNQGNVRNGRSMHMGGMMRMPAANPMPAMPGQAGYFSSAVSYEQVLQGAAPDNITVYCGGLAPFTTQNDLITLLQPFGYVGEIRLRADKGIAFVKLSTHEQAANAIYALSLNPPTLHGRQIKVSWGKGKTNPQQPGVAGGAIQQIGQPGGPQAGMGQQQGFSNMVSTRGDLV